MKILDSYSRVFNKRYKFFKLFGYAPDMPRAVCLGPQAESDEYEAFLDKCLADKVDYFEIKYGYDADKIRERIKREKHVFYD